MRIRSPVGPRPFAVGHGVHDLVQGAIGSRPPVGPRRYQGGTESTVQATSCLRDDRGVAAPLTLVLGIGFIVLPVMVLVLSIPTWEARTVDAQDAARAAARALAIASNWQQGESSANEAVNEIVLGDGLPPSDVTVAYSGSLVPGATVTASVTVVVPAGLPGLGFVGQLHYTASSTEHVDSYEGSPT